MHGLVITLLLTCGFLLIISSPLASYGQALNFNESNSIIFENRRISVTLQTSPAFLTEDQNVGSAVIRLREVGTNATIPHVTYHVKIMRTSDVLLDELFHTHTGIMSLRFENMDSRTTEVIGERESLYNAIVADQPVTVLGPILDGGLYNYNISVISLRQYENKLQEPLNFDVFASIGKTYSHRTLDSENKEHALFVKTYYDQITEINYDSSSREITFKMPLNWDISYLNQVPFIHEEVQIPRAFAELMSNSYIGTMNGVELSSREVMIDDYTAEDARIVHFVVPKDRLITIAQKQSPTQNIAIFTLAPRDIPKFPLEILSGKENFLLQIAWSPAVIEPDKSTKFIVTVRDPQTLDTINHARADFVLLKDGKEIFRKHHTAPIGAIVQDYTFTQDQTGSVLLLIENINNTGESAPLQFTVVPEFPFGTLITMIALVSVVILLTRLKPMRIRSSLR